MYSILWFAIGEPPSFCGAFQKMLTCVGEIAVTMGFVGGSGTVAALALFADIKTKSSENAISTYFMIPTRKCLLISP